DYELRVLVSLRVLGEIMVSVQYEPIVEALEQFGLPRYRQLFFYPHYLHDQKGGKEGWHAEQFDMRLSALITDERLLGVAWEQAQLACGVRFGIHDQFPS